jgi:glycosyltransferase involved in cell wall biosynthesis
VHFAGHLSEEQLPLAYRAADCVVVPSVALEGFGLTVVEALACGTPALVTPVGGLPEVVRDLDPALVLEASTPDAIARGLAAALRGDVPLPDSDACVDYARRFGWQTIAAQVRDVYREVA